LSDYARLKAKDAAFATLFGDYHIRIGYWPKLGTLPKWDRKDWPMPVSPAHCYIYETATKEKWENVPNEGFADSGAVEILLTAALAPVGYETMRVRDN
jgi:hypothetical protein